MRRGRRVNAASRTLSFAVSGCRHPGESTPSFELADGPVEVGVGIPGALAVALFPPSSNPTYLATRPLPPV